MNNITEERYSNHEWGPAYRSHGTRKNRSRFAEVVMMLRDKQKLQEQASTVWDRSLFILKRTNWIRRMATYITDSKFFEIFMILTIIANCIVLALEEHLPNNDKNTRTQELMKSEIFFLAIYLSEAVLKITSKGFFFGKGAYFKDHWNKLDLLVVVAGFVEYFMSNLDVDLTLLRMARVFRALKLISGIPHMKLVATTILRSVSSLLPVLFLVGLSVLIFAILGMDYYKGAFNRACFESEQMFCNKERICHYEMADERPCQKDTDGSGHHCTGNTTCRRYWKGPNDGITSFNNIGLALLTVFQCLTMEGWTDVYYLTNDAKGVWLNWLYFVPLVMFCAFFMMNLVLGILKGVFTREREKMQLEKEMVMNDGLMSKNAIRNYFQWINKGEKSFHEECRSEAEGARKDCGPEMIRVLYIRGAVESKAFFWGSMACVAANTIIAATEHYNQPQWLGDTQCILEIFFVVLFSIEVLMRIIAHGYRQYLFSKMNVFDLLVLVASIVELSIRTRGGNNGLKCSVFRALRLLRVFEKTRYKRNIDTLVQVMIDSKSSVLSLLFLLFLFLFLAAVIGMQLFGGRFNFIEGRPAAHFDSFPKALLTVFQIVTGEDWNSVMFNGIRAYGGIDGVGVSVAIFFIVVVLFGNYTLLNVFFAIAVDSLAEAKDREDESKCKPNIDRGEHGQNSAKSRTILNAECLNPDRSLFLLNKTNKFRICVSKAVNHKHFETLVMVCIVLSSITLAAEDPTTGHNSLLNQILYWVDVIFAVIFTLEMMLKIIDMGLLLHRGSYLRNGWNCIDCVIVIASLVSLSIRNSSVNSIKIFRILRVLRIFKTINKFPGLKSACVMFIKSIKSVGPLLFIYVLMQVIFAIMAVQLLQGKLFYCNDSTKLTRDQCRGQYIDYTKYQMGKLEVLDREWRRRDFHFDDVFEAMTTLFVITTGEGWPDIFDSAVSSAGVDRGPSQSEDKLIAAFFVVYIVIAPFFFLNVFIAMITVAFQSEDVNKKKKSGLTERQENCILYVVRAEPDHARFIPKDASWIRQKLWRIVISDRFENLILLLVVLNTICLVMEYEDQPPTYSTALWYSNLAFVIIFFVEAALKIFVLRKNYFSDNWNKIDFVIVVGSVIDVVLDLLKIQGINFRVFRAARTAKILKKFTSLRFLLWSFYLSMKSLPYVFFLNILSFYVFAVLGMQMFGNIKLDDDTAINRYNNFCNIFTSLLVLFRCATGENWQLVMLACSGSRPCTGDNLDTSCGSDFATVYFIVFISLSAFLMMNLFEAVIVNNFDYLHADPADLGPRHLHAFTDVWHKYADFHDPKTLEVRHLKDFVKSMNPPLGFGNKCPRRQLHTKFMKMNLTLTRKEINGHETVYVNFVEVLFGLVRLALGLHTEEWKDNAYLRGIIEEQMKVEKTRLDLMIPETATELGLREYTCIQIWQEALSRKKQQPADDNPMRKIIDLGKSIERRISKGIRASRRNRPAASSTGSQVTETNL